MEAIEENSIWRLTTLPPGHRVIGLKWVYKVKTDAHGAVLRGSLAVTVKGTKPYNNRQFMVLSEKTAPSRARIHVETIKKFIGADKNLGRNWESRFARRTDARPISLSGGWREGHFSSFPSPALAPASPPAAISLLFLDPAATVHTPALPGVPHCPLLPAVTGAAAGIDRIDRRRGELFIPPLTLN
jgi:hypothetical protein